MKEQSKYIKSERGIKMVPVKDASQSKQPNLMLCMILYMVFILKDMYNRASVAQTPLES